MNYVFLTKVMLISASLFWLYGCTPEIEHHIARTWDDIKTYDYSVWRPNLNPHTPPELWTYDELYEWQNIKDCDGTRKARSVSINGVNDEFHYTSCYRGPHEIHPPQRQ